MKLSKEEIDSLIVNDILIGNHFRVAHLHLDPEIATDIAIAISYMQDYLNTIDCVEQQEHYDTIRLTIERLFQFYYQLVGFDPNNIRTIMFDQID